MSVKKHRVSFVVVLLKDFVKGLDFGLLLILF